MIDLGILGWCLLIANCIFSYFGLKSELFFDKYKFQIESIRYRQQYYRLLSTGFLHVNLPHLIFNMVTLYAFCGAIEQLNPWAFLIIYFGSLIGGDLFSLFVHRNHDDYSAAGASGALAGVVFAHILLFPHSELGIFGIPWFIPAWIYGVLYILISIYGVKSQKGNIGHDAHLGGALAGLFIAAMYYPELVQMQPWVFLVLALPALVFIGLILINPKLLWMPVFVKNSKNYGMPLDYKYNAEKHKRQLEIDRLLDKINRSGYDSLSKDEKDRLKKYSEKLK